MYKWGLLDGNFFLRRNFMAAKRNKDFIKAGYKPLVRSFLSTIFNYQKQFKFEVPIIAWDKSPYKKMVVIENYKSNRHYTNKKDVESIDEKILRAKTEEEKNKLLKKKDEIERDLKCEEIFQHAKASLLKHLEGTAIHCVRIQGYEADDIAYLFSKLILEKDNDKRGLLISIDGDWRTFINEKVDYFKEARNRKSKSGFLYTLDNSKFIQDANEAGCSLYEMGNLREIYTGGHNNVIGLDPEIKGYNHQKDINMIQFARAIKSENKTLPDYNYYRELFEALNINNYDNSDAFESISIAIRNDKHNDHFENISEYFRELNAGYLISNYKNLKIASIDTGYIF